MPDRRTVEGSSTCIAAAMQTFFGLSEMAGEGIQRMAGDIIAEQFLFVRKHLIARPGLNFWTGRAGRRWSGRLERIEKRRLPAGAIPLDGGRRRHGQLDIDKELGAGFMEIIEGAAT